MQQQCLSLPYKCIYSRDIFHNLLIFNREVNCAALSREVNQTDALHVPCYWLFTAHVTLSDEHASELNPEMTEKVYTKCSEPAEPDLNKVGFVWFCQLYTYSLSLFN